ncbi:hypothetical protein [Mesonia aquimarina]|uniref:hypothetical protein n=1 Tax=Mesonia aquimarina TaxID=1504967 RepID=UPI000EF5837D|nr:hypothetical protein [Mesonia aquimarina]
MTKRIFILILSISVNLSAQKNTKSLFGNFVECYYSEKETEPILIYENLNGKVIAELETLKESNCWYKFSILESKNGWLKIENITILPSCRENTLNKNFELYKGKWILANKMKINISDLDVESKNGVKFFKKPDLNSELAYQSGKFLETELIETNGLWAKVSFIINGNKIVGWLQRKDQCAYPWTSCPYRTE